MLELKNIKKDYPAGDGIVHALKGIDLQFRTNEFVSILGQSGCGKTTLLNIIGGLDHYTSGDLIINGRSTKEFKDRDWDTYRNHSIGFVFQSYNLIPHQSVLQNVELALTLTGVSRAERKARAKEALEKVGLGNQLSKKPSQMSGGQMQRVAIARALVNNPDIILADEPTGALDTETSVQVMEILKEISKDKLIIMVTHNPELAEQYSTRIIRMLDGELIDDSHPIDDDEYLEIRAEERARKREREKEKRAKRRKREKMPSMSLATSFSLSLKNLIAKRGRTILTSFAGSIGIIGIALILSISQGLTAYIDMVQESTLASYPLTIQSTSIDISSLLQTFVGSGSADDEHDKDAIYSQDVLYQLVEAMNNLETTENDLKAFKEYIEAERAKDDSPLKDAINGIQYTYALDLLVYTENVDGTIIPSDTQQLLTELLADAMRENMSNNNNESSGNSSGSASASGGMMSMGGGMTLWQEMLSGDDGKLVNDLLENQYDVIYGSWPNSYDEIVLVVDRNNELSDMTLYALGLESKENMDAIINSAFDKTHVELEKKSWSYEEICDMEFRVILNSDCYTYDKNTETYTDLRDTEAGLKYLYDKAISLKVSGIIRPSEDADNPMLSGSIGYTSELTKYVIENAKDSDAIKVQLANPNMDIFTGLPFKDNTTSLTDDVKEEYFREYVKGLTMEEKAAMYVAIMSIPSEEVLNSMVDKAMEGIDRATIEATLTKVMAQQMGMEEKEIAEYLAEMSDEDLFKAFRKLMEEQVKMQYAAQVAQQMMMMPAEQKAAALDMAMETYTTEQCAIYYNEVLVFSDSSYERNLRELGYIDLESPQTMNFFASSFENKDIIEEAIAEYNASVDEVKEIKYTDYVGIMMSSITTIINAITYILIAFVAISLVVSSIMIAVITLISVQERTKEIGILRAMGASKRNVSVMFNAETILIGLASGILGVVVTVILCFPINAIIHAVTDINSLNAYLPFGAAIILIAISVILNLFSGLIPAKSAAKKDPVVALRTE
ncbi:MAG: ABC transporter ATP-binding protein/permease [Lachnospiraceae bacterium]|nr:ABC transporter ATP-binding protein/permease [Lachnospiraceae bacterium]